MIMLNSFGQLEQQREKEKREKRAKKRKKERKGANANANHQNKVFGGQTIYIKYNPRGG